MPIEKTEAPKGTRRLRMEDLNKDGCVMLLREIVRGAKADYVSAMEQARLQPASPKAVAMYRARRRFFLSPYFHSLTQLDGEQILELIDEENGGNIDGLLKQYETRRRLAAEPTDIKSGLTDRQIAAIKKREYRHRNSRMVMESCKGLTSGEKLQRLRGTCSRLQASAEMGVPQNTLAGAEAGTVPRDYTKLLICQYYGVEESEIWS